MVNGPPTPPPTSATELQDEARTRAPVASPAAPAAPVASATTTTTTQPRQPTDAYQYILPKLVNLAAQNDFGALVRLAEQTDLNVGKSLSEKLLYLTPAGR
jgi:COP9 signalosome complex subunit 8